MVALFLFVLNCDSFCNSARDAVHPLLKTWRDYFMWKKFLIIPCSPTWGVFRPYFSPRHICLLQVIKRSESCIWLFSWWQSFLVAIWSSHDVRWDCHIDRHAARCPLCWCVGGSVHSMSSQLISHSPSPPWSLRKARVPSTRPTPLKQLS